MYKDPFLWFIWLHKPKPNENKQKDHNIFFTVSVFVDIICFIISSYSIESSPKLLPIPTIVSDERSKYYCVDIMKVAFTIQNLCNLLNRLLRFYIIFIRTSHVLVPESMFPTITLQQSYIFATKYSKHSFAEDSFCFIEERMDSANNTDIFRSISSLATRIRFH